MIANRPKKKVFPSIINEKQTSVISGRFIDENTRKMYDTIHYCTTYHKKELSIKLDYSKAFDTIEWSFINETLTLLNFGPIFRAKVSLCHVNSSSRVQQNGHLSERFLYPEAFVKVTRYLLMFLYYVQKYYLIFPGVVEMKQS